MGFFRFLYGIVVGLGAGYLAGRMAAPVPGGELQSELNTRYHSIRDQAKQAADETRRDLEARYDAAKRSGSYRI